MSGSLSSSAAAAQDARFRVVWSRQRVELSHFSTAAQSELFDTDSESDPAQSQQMPGAFKPPAPQAPVRYTCVQDLSEASLGSLLLCVAPHSDYWHHHLDTKRAVQGAANSQTC